MSSISARDERIWWWLVRTAALVVFLYEVFFQGASQIPVFAIIGGAFGLPSIVKLDQRRRELAQDVEQLMSEKEGGPPDERPSRNV